MELAVEVDGWGPVRQSPRLLLGRCVVDEPFLGNLVQGAVGLERRDAGIDRRDQVGALGEDEAQILADELAVSDLLHLVGYTDARKVLWASDLTVLPSAYEGLPMAIIEAMLCGVVPIRTPAAGAMDQIQDGIDGFLFPFEDHLALADRIEQLISAPNLREQMASAALASAREKFSLQSMIDKTICVYKSVLVS